MPGATLKMTGQPTTYLKTTADSGKPRLQAFCPRCGAPIYSTTPGDGVQPSYTVRVGMLRQRDRLPPKRQTWWRSARPWVTELAAGAEIREAKLIGAHGAGLTAVRGAAINPPRTRFIRRLVYPPRCRIETWKSSPFSKASPRR